MWRERVESDLGISLGGWRQVSGGDFAQSWCAEVTALSSSARGSAQNLSPGDRIFIKTHASPPPRHFTTEGSGLVWLREAGALSVPAVLGVSDDPPYLALEFIEEGHGSAQSEVELGRGLAKLHQSECSCFGREDSRSTGSLGLPNAPVTTWSEFFATQRLLPLARIASKRQALKDTTIRRIDTLASRLHEYVDAAEPPARLHGDLWAGNRLVDVHGCNWLIDPASHGGHREFDLAMMRLFGGFGEQCFSAYDEQYPLADGWRDRVQLHQLAPLIVHAIKFGSAYVGPTEAALARYL